MLPNEIEVQEYQYADIKDSKGEHVWPNKFITKIKSNWANDCETP